MAWTEMGCAVAGIVTVLFACLQVCVGEDGFQLLERDCGRLSEPEYGSALNDDMTPKIINGVTAKFGSHPWMAFIRTPLYFTCGGSLISHWFVLTAAHCIKDDPLMVILGEYNRDQEEDCLGNLCMDPYEVYDVTLALKHKFYDSKQHSNDIALLRLDRRVTYKAHIQPVCVFVDSKMKPLVDRLTWFNATGWGYTSPGKNTARVLQELRLNRRPHESCERMFGKRMTSTQICSGNDDSNLCNGDSGGPQGREMAYGGRRVYVQLGIASFTNRECKDVSILTDVVSHGNWIKRVVRRYSIPDDKAPGRPAQRESLDRKPTFYRPI